MAKTRRPPKWCALISGGGSTLTAVLQDIRDPEGTLHGFAEVGCVITNIKTAGGIQKALDLGVPESDIGHFVRNDYCLRSEWGTAMAEFAKKRGCTHFAQLGWLPLTPESFLQKFDNGKNGFNQHPGPLDPGRPDFGGKGMFGRAVHAARLFFVKSTMEANPWTEATTQFVAAKYDEGGIIGRRRVEIKPNDGVEELQQRVLPVEHALVIETMRKFADKRPPTLQRDESLVRDGGMDGRLLEQAKQFARWAFPHG